MPSKQSTNTVLITCDVVVELIGEVQQNGLASRTLAPCSKRNEEFLFSSCNSHITQSEWERKAYLGLHCSSSDGADGYRWRS